jgi:hypothetical protein
LGGRLGDVGSRESGPKLHLTFLARWVDFQTFGPGTKVTSGLALAAGERVDCAQHVNNMALAIPKSADSSKQRYSTTTATTMKTLLQDLAASSKNMMERY